MIQVLVLLTVKINYFEVYIAADINQKIIVIYHKKNAYGLFTCAIVAVDSERA